MIGRRQPPVLADDNQPERPKGFDDYALRLGDIMRGERATLGKSLLDVQRELKIRATYISAIENTDPSAFETPGFVAGYVRSYARYLGLDPEWAYQTFCDEGNFATVHGMEPAASSPARRAKVEAKPRVRDPLADPNASFVPRGEAMLSRIEPGAVGSTLVLLLLAGVLGFGGWTVLQQVQRVTLAPVDQAPGVFAEVDPLAPSTATDAGLNLASSDTALREEALDRLYRPKPLDVPVLVARDGPISTLNPGQLQAIEAPENTPRIALADPAPEVPATDAAPVRVVTDNVPETVVFATRPAWVRVTAADGTVLLEKILDEGERYVLPKTEDAPRLRTGYAGAIYFAVNGTAYGPVGEGASVVKNIELAPEALSSQYAVADLKKNPELARMVAELTTLPAQ